MLMRILLYVNERGACTEMRTLPTSSLDDDIKNFNIYTKFSPQTFLEIEMKFLFIFLLSFLFIII